VNALIVNDDDQDVDHLSAGCHPDGPSGGGPSQYLPAVREPPSVRRDTGVWPVWFRLVDVLTGLNAPAARRPVECRDNTAGGARSGCRDLERVILAAERDTRIDETRPAAASRPVARDALRRLPRPRSAMLGAVDSPFGRAVVPRSIGPMVASSRCRAQRRVA
jgi:hypothetical protein